MSEWVFIQAYSSRFEAEQAQQYLEQQGIDAFVKADDGGGMYPGLSLGRKGVRLMVRDEDTDRARGALEPGEVVDLVEAASPGAGSAFVPAPLVASQTAADLFDAGHNCAEAVLRTFAEDWGTPRLVRLATGFGGGMGRAGDVCGAMSGAVMAVGARFGRVDPDDDVAKERCYEAVTELRERFRDSCGHLQCRDLTGLDLTTESGRRAAEDGDLHGTVCRQCVRAAAGLAAEIMARD
jgi:C_GCAxxG_C_C family probable redox protein